MKLFQGITALATALTGALLPIPVFSDETNLRVRRSLRELENMWIKKKGKRQNPKPLEDLMRAWSQIQSLSHTHHNSFFKIAGFHGMPFLGKGATNSSYWGGYCNHGNVLFPTWHRAYLVYLEKALQSFEPDVMMPYWDETSEESLKSGIPWSLTNTHFIFVDGTKIRNPLQSYTLQENIVDYNDVDHFNYTKPYDYTTVRYPLSGIWNNQSAIEKSMKHNSLFPTHENRTETLNDNVKAWLKGGYVAKVENAWSYTSICNRLKSSLTMPTYTVFSNSNSAVAYNKKHVCKRDKYSLETPHGDVHLAVGGFYWPGGSLQQAGRITGANGDMGENENAGFDPIFFFHHCNVDRMFWLWQKQHDATDHLHIDPYDIGAWTNQTIDGKPYGQGPAYKQQMNEALTIHTFLYPFLNDDNTNTTSQNVTNIETQLHYTYSDGSFSAGSGKEVCPKSSAMYDHGKQLLISGINTALFRGSFVIAAHAVFADNSSIYLGHSSHFGKYRNPDSYPDYNINLGGLSAEDIANVKDYKVEFSHHGEELPSQLEYSTSVIDDCSTGDDCANPLVNSVYCPFHDVSNLLEATKQEAETFGSLVGGGGKKRSTPGTLSDGFNYLYNGAGNPYNNFKTYPSYTATKSEIMMCYEEYYGSDYSPNTVVKAALEMKYMDFPGSPALSQDFGNTVRRDQYYINEESAKKINQYTTALLEMYQLMEEAVQVVKDGCISYVNKESGEEACELAVRIWDNAAAIQDGPNYLGTKRCKNYLTCGYDYTNTDTIAIANQKVLNLFQVGQSAIRTGDIVGVKGIIKLIQSAQLVSYIQGVGRYAQKIAASEVSCVEAENKDYAEGGAFATGMLPQLYKCNRAAAKTVDKMFQLIGDNCFSGTIEEFLDTIRAEYQCLGITCEDVGGLWDGTAYYPGAGPCVTMYGDYLTV